MTILKTMRTWLNEASFWIIVCIFFGGFSLSDILKKLIVDCLGFDFFIVRSFIEMLSIFIVLILFSKLSVTSSKVKDRKRSK